MKNLKAKNPQLRNQPNRNPSKNKNPNSLPKKLSTQSRSPPKHPSKKEETKTIIKPTSTKKMRQVPPKNLDHTVNVCAESL